MTGVPQSAVLAGYDLDKSKIYVARAFHQGDLIPGKYIPSKHAMYICWNGKEILKDEFEVLSATDACWVQSANGKVHPGAIVCGHASTGELLYVGRVFHKGSLTPGKVHPSHESLFIPFDGLEHRIKRYEILVSRG